MGDVTHEPMFETLKSIQSEVTDVTSGQTRIEADPRSVRTVMAQFMGDEVLPDREVAELRERHGRNDRLELMG